jgi:glycosyltransferase involved in cell wall biosynthesis
MRILFLIDSRIDSPGVGGAETSLRQMIPYFRGAGIEPVVVCFRTRGAEVDGEKDNGYVSYFLDGLSRVQQMREIRRILHDERIDLMHTTLFQADVFGRTAAAGTGVPVVTSLVTIPYDGARIEHDKPATRTKLAVARFVEAMTGVLFADHFHAITQAVKDASVSALRVPENRTTVVYRGRDAQRLGRRSPERRRRVRERLGVSDETFLVLNAGRQDYPKGQTVLLEAMEPLLAREPNALLVIAGRDGAATPELQELMKRKRLNGSVRFLGHRSDVPDLMAAADTFALSSLWEGLACVNIEALALEAPIVASDLPAVREVLDGGVAGILVPPRDPQALAQGLVRIRREAGLGEELARRGRRRFEELFTLERSAQGMIDIYERVARRRPVSPAS